MIYPDAHYYHSYQKQQFKWISDEEKNPYYPLLLQQSKIPLDAHKLTLLILISNL